MIYAVVHFVAYESHAVVRAFTEEPDAERFKAKIEEYERAKPAYQSTQEGIVALREWINNHPAGPHFTQADRWDIVPIPLNDEDQVRLDNTPWKE